MAIDEMRQPVRRPEAVLGACLGEVALEALALLGRRLRGPLLRDVIDVEAGVPDVERAHLGEFAHRLAVRAPHGTVDRRTLRRVEAAVASGDREARREPFDVPLERSRMRLV